jgi:condensin complex subunit 2
VAQADDIDDNLIEGNNGAGYALSLQHKYQEDAEHESIMAYFDKAFNSRAKGKLAFMTLENWRMQKIQKAQQGEAAAPTRQRKEKEPFEIDFLGPMSDSLKELLEAPAVLNSQISLPKAQWRTKGRNLLDRDDEVIDPRKLMRLWTKPKCRVGRRKGGMGVIDEGFGARNRLGTANNGETDELNDEEGGKGDYDADFFADDDEMPFFDGPLPIDDDDDDGIVDGDGDDGGQAFMDAREMLSPQPEGNQQQNLLGSIDDVVEGEGSQQQPPDSQFPHVPQSQSDLLPGSFGSQLVTQGGRRLRPEYVNYARTAKKVDVRRLKENMWKGMSEKLIAVFDRPPPQAPAAEQPPPVDEDIDMMDVDDRPDAPTPEADMPATPTAPDADVLNCFICLLHLANEKGLVLEGEREGDKAMQEIKVFRDRSVGEGYEGE